jgi:ABC-2 type transport system ATP-binding protein
MDGDLRAASAARVLDGPERTHPEDRSADGGSAAVETVGLTRRFGALTAVDAVTLRVPQRCIFGLVGPNGAGKSTTIKMLTTLLPPTSGCARVAGFDVAAQALQVRRRIGYVPQLLSADGALTGYENLLLLGKLYGIPTAVRRQRIQGALDLLGLVEARDTLVRHYSGGMIRRLEIAQAILHRPVLLFLDEPTVGLDPVARRGVWAHIRALRQEYGTTVLMTTHAMEEADELCDLVAIMDRGRVAVVAPPPQLKASTGPDASLEDAYVHFVGASPDAGGSYSDAVSTRRTARRLG